MNTEELVNMIDAISEGKAFTLPIDETVNLVLGKEAFGFSGTQSLDLVAHYDSRTAREIAAALISWANRQEAINPANQVEWLETLLKAARLQVLRQVKEKESE